MLQLSHLKPNSLATVFFALFILSACGGGGDAAAPAAANTGTGNTDDGGASMACPLGQTQNSANDCVSDEVLAFQTTEYSKSGALGGVKTAEAYANIATLIAADAALATPTNMIKQGGEGQTISIASDFGFNTTHQEFTNVGSLYSTAFSSIYNASTQTQYIGTAVTNGAGKCSGTDCDGTQYAALIAGRKGGYAPADDPDGNQMHGIAYNTQLQGILGYFAEETQRINAIENGVGADIIAMNHAWGQSSAIACYNHPTYGSLNYNRPHGQNFRTANTDGTCTTNISNSAQISDTELTAWTTAVTDSATTKTIMVFGAGDLGLNSENGVSSLGVIAVTVVANGDSSANPMDANIPDYYAAYPALYTESGTDGDFTSDRWLVVTGLDTAGAIYTFSNGCGVAMHFCLAAPGDAVHSAGEDGTSNVGYDSVSSSTYASSTVAGALAVLKGAFPNATPEELTRLVLETSDYIELTTHDDAANRTQITMADGTSTRYINPVYGYGKLNLETATTPSVSMSYVTASNNQSIGALWQDTKLTLSSHFGGNFESVKFGIGDAYGRHFITAAPQTSYAPVAVSLDDYMANMLADNVQTQKIGGQAQLNYSNSGETWMNLEYISGKATTKIAFQDSYKVNPLSDTGTTTILRANNIRPASSNIGMMDVDYKLGNALVLSSYLARGEYDTGYKFDELGTDFDVNYKDSHLNIAIGNIREHGQFLGTNTTGAYALNAPSISRFTDVTYGHNLGKFNIYANYINYETDVDMLHDQFASIDNLQADQYQIGFTGKDLISKDDSLNVALITKLGVTDGALNQNTVLGYTADGAYNNASQSYDLAVSNRHQQFEITYQGKLYQNADKISALRDNRFFTSIRVDSNLNHVEGASQVEVVSGINIKY